MGTEEMSKLDKTDQEQSPRPPSGDDIALLLRFAGPRQSAPSEREERVKVSFYADWQDMLRARRRRRTAIWASAGLAAAASLAALTLMPRHLSEPVAAPVPRPIAELEAQIGSVEAVLPTAGDQSRSQRLRIGDAVLAGARVVTGQESGVAFRLALGPSLRLAADTEVRFDSETLLLLERGRLYIDSRSDSPTEKPIAVQTALGLVQEVGTQFEVRAGADSLRVRVREGLVNLTREGEAIAATEGRELTVGVDGSLHSARVDIFGPEWDWILEVAPSFELEGQTLGSFLSWVSRETRWEIDFDEQTLSANKELIVLHGSITGLRPDQALEAVLPTCDLSFRIEDGTARIFTANKPS
jgi:ferric-dicitrate binding protein FerR (iron transport regulator)